MMTEDLEEIAEVTKIIMTEEEESPHRENLIKEMTDIE